MKDTIKVVALGGLDENGRDCYVVEINDDLFVLDCGLSFADRTAPGIDYFIPNEDYLVEHKDKIKAYILTHGHDENMGGILYIYDHVPAPIYCSKSTRAILLAQGEFNGVKIPKFDFHIVEPSSSVEIAGHVFHFFQTTHNAPKSFGVAIETSEGNVVYTSDFIVDYSVESEEFKFDLKALSNIADKPTLLLMADSKSAGKEGYCAPRHRLSPHIEKYFIRSTGRVFICLFYQNIYRLYEIFALAKAHRKRIYPYDDFTRRFLNIILTEDEQNVFKKEDLLAKEDLLRVKQEDLIILMLGKENDLYDSIYSLSNHTNQDKRIALLPTDTFIIAAVPIPTLESAATQCTDFLYRSGCHVVWLKGKDVVSMHPGQDDLKLMLSLLKPKYYFPVRGSYVNLMNSAKLALSMKIGLNHSSVFVLDNGTQLHYQDDKMTIISNQTDRIHTIPSMVDGLGTVKGDTLVVDDRKKLAVDGVAVLAATVSKSKKKIIAGPDCQMRGFVFVKDAEPTLKMMTSIFVDGINALIKADMFDFDSYSSVIEEKIKKSIHREISRDPLIVLSISVVD